MALSNLRRLAASLLICLLSLSLPVQTSCLHAGEIPAQKTNSAAVVSEKSADVEGIAFYYAKRYNGRKTNSGVRYDPAKMTAAHPDLPHGTRVKVVNIANSKEVVVMVNDRCRKRKVPVIDLSRAAAKELGFLGKGAARVKIIPLKESESEDFKTVVSR